MHRPAVETVVIEQGCMDPETGTWRTHLVTITVDWRKLAEDVTPRALANASRATMRCSGGVFARIANAVAR